MILLVLRHMVDSGITMKEEDAEIRIFSKREKAEEWLLDNNFTYKRREYFKGDPYDWCHEADEAWQYITVDFCEVIVDSCQDSKFKHMTREPSPWEKAAIRDGFIETMQKEGKSIEEIKKAYEEHFKEKWHYKL